MSTSVVPPDFERQHTHITWEFLKALEGKKVSTWELAHAALNASQTGTLNINEILEAVWPRRPKTSRTSGYRESMMNTLRNNTSKSSDFRKAFRIKGERSWKLCLTGSVDGVVRPDKTVDGMAALIQSKVQAGRQLSPRELRLSKRPKRSRRGAEARDDDDAAVGSSPSTLVSITPVGGDPATFSPSQPLDSPTANFDANPTTFSLFEHLPDPTPSHSGSPNVLGYVTYFPDIPVTPLDQGDAAVPIGIESPSFFALSSATAPSPFHVDSVPTILPGIQSGPDFSPEIQWDEPSLDQAAERQMEESTIAALLTVPLARSFVAAVPAPPPGRILFESVEALPSSDPSDFPSQLWDQENIDQFLSECSSPAAPSPMSSAPSASFPFAEDVVRFSSAGGASPAPFYSPPLPVPTSAVGELSAKELQAIYFPEL